LQAEFVAISKTVDSSRFPVGREIDYENKVELERLASLRHEAEQFLRGLRWTPPIAELTLAFGVAPIAALYLARFERGVEGEGNCDTEVWVMVGDLPPAYFVVDECPRPVDALEVYCELMEDWADNVTAGADLSASYPVTVEPTIEHAHMLKGRIEFIREELIPLA
jgi:hypothetical protein